MSFITLDTIGKEDDLRYLATSFAANDQALFSTRVPTHTPEVFRSWLDQRLRSSFPDFRMIRMIGADNSVTTIGFVHNYELSLIDGHCKIVVYVDQLHRGTGLGIRAAVLFVGYLFEIYSLHKVYSMVYSYNEQSLSSCLAAGFTEEGVLKEYRFNHGTWHDLHVLSLTRSDFENKLGEAWKLWRH